MKFRLDRQCRIGTALLISIYCIKLCSSQDIDKPPDRGSLPDSQSTHINDRVDERLEAKLQEHLPVSKGPQELPIDLPTVLRLAGTDALEVQLAGERVTEAHAQTLAADMQFLPRIGPEFVNNWHHGEVQSTTGQFERAHKQSSLIGGQAAATWRIGESVFASLAARRRAAASEEGLKAVTDDIRIQAVNAFFNLVLSRAGQAIVEDRLKQADETVRLSETMQKRGAGLLSEVKRSEAARAEVRQRLAAAKEQVRFASLALTDVLHIDPLVSLIPQQEPQDVILLVSGNKDLTGLVSDAMARRPELSESRALWAALDKERKASILAPLVPTIRADSFAGGFGRHPGTTKSAQDYTIGLQWTVGLGGIGDVSRTRIAESRLRQESIRFGKIADHVVREVVENHTHVNASSEQIELAKQEVAAAEEALKLSQDRLKTGTALTIEVLAAEDQLFAAKSRAANGISEYNKAQYGLLRSIGGFRGTDTSPGADSSR